MLNQNVLSYIHTETCDVYERNDVSRKKKKKFEV